MPNPCSKTRSPDAPYEIWATEDGSWKWYVLKKYQSEEREATNPYARWYCKVLSPITPNGEIGDVYCTDIKAKATKIYPNSPSTE